jgi:hypothetical protein
MMPLPKITAILLLLLMIECFSPSIKKKSESIESKTIPTESLCPQSNKTPDELYPAWFWNTPYSEDSLFAVGYSNTFFHTETSQKEAIENGIESLAKSVSVRIKGERGLMRHGGGVACSGFEKGERSKPALDS